MAELKTKPVMIMVHVPSGVTIKEVYGIDKNGVPYKLRFSSE